MFAGLGVAWLGLACCFGVVSGQRELLPKMIVAVGWVGLGVTVLVRWWMTTSVGSVKCLAATREVLVVLVVRGCKEQPMGASGRNEAATAAHRCCPVASAR